MLGAVRFKRCSGELMWEYANKVFGFSKAAMASSAAVKKIVGDLAESRTHHDQHTVSELHKPQKMVNKPWKIILTANNGMHVSSSSPTMVLLRTAGLPMLWVS
ncbi:hypothetical protein ACFX13_020147 [Malus domestica]